MSAAPSVLLDRLVAEIGRYEGRQGVEDVVARGYRGDVSPELLAAFGGENAVRRAVQRACHRELGW